MKYQVAIIGGGPAGYTAAELAGKAGLSVVLFEKNNVGGVCLNEGCIPTKTLLYASKLSYICMNARKYNVSADAITCDLPKMIARKAKVVRKLVLGIKAKLNAAHVTLVNGEASIVDKNTVRCGEETYECEHLILCTGSRTVIPPIPGIDKVAYWTHREALDNKALPQSLVIVGGGVIGMEFASFFCDLGVKVTVIEMMDEILNGIDREIASLLRAEYAVVFKLGAKVTQLKQDDSGIYVCYESEGEEACVAAEKLLLSVGRRPVTEGFGLENLGLGYTEKHCIKQKEGIAYRAIKFPMTYSGRFVAENEGENGWMKVLTDADNKVLGVHLLGNPASELIVLGGMLVEDGCTLDAFRRYVFPHPTVGELFRDL